MTFRRVIVPLIFPGLVAASIFTFSLTLGDYITPIYVGKAYFIGNAIYNLVGLAEQPAARGGVRDGPRRDHGDLPHARAAGSGAFEAL